MFLIQERYLLTNRRSVMSKLNRMTGIWASITILCLLIGCAGSNASPVLPGDGEPGVEIAAGNCVEDSSGTRTLLGYWDVTFDLENKAVEIMPDRSAFAHMEISDFLMPPFCSDCLKIRIESIDYGERILVFSVTIKNPWDSIDGYAVRGIFISDNENHRILNADSYTKFWDTHDPQQINPFLGFPHGGFVPEAPLFPGGVELSRNYTLAFGDPPGFLQISYAIDACYPGPPDEPFSICEIVTDGTLFENSGSMYAHVCAFDAQDDIDKVMLDTTMFTGAPIEMTPTIFHNYDVRFDNVMHPAAGDYRLLVTATSENSGDTAIYHYIDVTVHSSSMLLTDITPEFLNLTPVKAVVEGNYAYVASSTNGLIIYDISNPANPTPIKKVPLPEKVDEIVISDGYVWCNTDYWDNNDSYYIYVIDIDPVESAFLAYTWTLDYRPGTVGVSDHLAYVVEYPPYDDSFVEIFDFNDISNPIWLSRIDGLDGPPRDIDIVNGIACAVTNNWLYVIDARDPVNAFLAKALNICPVSGLYAVEIKDGYAFTGGPMSGDLRVADIDPPEDAEAVFDEYGLDMGTDFTIKDDYLYTYGAFAGGVIIYDISTPELPFLYGTCLEGRQINSLAFIPGAAFSVGNNYVNTMEFTVPDQFSVLTEIPTPTGSAGLVVRNGYVYSIGSGPGSFMEIDTSSPENAFVDLVFDDWRPDTALVDDGTYVYTMTDDEFVVLDFSVQGSPQIVSSITLAGDLSEIVKRDDVVVCRMYNRDIHSFDVTNPALPQHEGTFTTVNYVSEIDYYDGYLYLRNSGNDTGITIYDISDPGNPSEITTFGTEYSFSSDMEMNGQYLYVTNQDFYGDAMVFDLENPETPVMINTFPDSGYYGNILIDGNWAWISASSSCKVYNVSNPASPVFAEYYPFGMAHVELGPDSYLYTSQGDGVHVYELN